MWASLIWCLAAATPASGARVSAEEREAASLAPILWLANDEPAYPMLPHAFAFDGIDNDCDGRIDLEDPDEVDDEREFPKIGEYVLLLQEAETWRSRHEQGQPLPSASCGRSRAFGYGRSPETGVPRLYFGPQPRVLFVGDADREEVFGHGAKSKADARDRTRPSRWHQAIDPATELIQFWMYYPFDLGPNAHRHDGEHVSVFFEREGDAGGVRRVKAVVGAGHEDNSVNNALVAGSLDAVPPTNLVLPRELPRHIPILVELGKHASAPDVNCNGRFDLGADANVYSESVWGNRDVWAGSAGKVLKIGRFEPWFSFPRNRDRRLLVDGWWRDDSIGAHLRSCDDLTRDPDVGSRDTATDQTPGGLEVLPESQRRGAAARLARTYQLFRLRYLYELYDLLGQDRCEDDGTCATVLEKFFNDPERRRAYWGDRAPDLVRVDPRAAARMRRWAEESERVHHIARRDVWKHEYFKNPDTVFRQWLFRRFGIGGEERVEGGNLLAGPVFRISDLLLKDTRIEAYVHFDRTLQANRMGRFYDAGFDYFSSRTRFIGSYFGLAYNRQFRTHVAASAGIYAYLANLRLEPFRLPRDLSFSVYTGINGELFRGKPVLAQGDEAAAGAELPSIPKAEALRFQVGIRAVWGFGGPKHPLAR